MLNLLVSILGDSFDKFQLSSQEIDCMEMCSTIFEVESMMFFRRGSRYEGLYLIACESESKVKSEWDGKILILRKQLDEINEKITENNLMMNKKIEENNSEINKKLEGITSEMMRNKSEMLGSLERIENLLQGKSKNE